MFERKCPDCEIILKYKKKYDRDRANKNKTRCRSCRNKGENNPFYEKNHTEETKEKIRLKNKGNIHTEEYKKNHSNMFSGEGNPMYGKYFYDIWVEKYGVDIAELKLKELKIKRSLNAKGENNHMYGKPAPKGSGNGWSGWYKDLYFRSITELSFIINVIERFGFSYESGEKKKYKIEYIENGQKKSYFPDFILNGKYVVECKPKKLQELKRNKLKEKYAKKYCEIKGYKYKIFDTLYSLKFEKIKTLYDNNNIKFTKVSEEKFITFKEKYGNRQRRKTRNNK